MNWDAIGAVGEVVGGLGVIITLAYLAMQIRTNTKALRNETLRDSIGMVIDSYTPIIADEEIAAIYLRGLESYDNLSDVEKIRFHYLCTQRLHAASTSTSLSMDDTPSDDTRKWVGRMMERPGFRQWWEQRGQYVMTQGFQEFVEDIRQNTTASSDS